MADERLLPKQPTTGSPSHRIRVWDLPTRLFHWSLVLLMIGSFVTINVGGNWTEWHFYCGYAILTLVLFRVLWGVIGGRYARFSSFMFGPASIIRYLRKHPEAPVSPGHNPLGSLSVWAMLLAVGFQAVSGLFSNDDIASEGPLASRISKDTSDFITSLHHLNEPVILVLVGLHVLAIIAYRVFGRQNLVGPMIHGDREVPADGGDSHGASSPEVSSSLSSLDNAALRWRALLVLAACAAIVWRVVR